MKFFVCVGDQALIEVKNIREGFEQIQGFHACYQELDEEIKEEYGEEDHYEIKFLCDCEKLLLPNEIFGQCPYCNKFYQLTSIIPRDCRPIIQ